MIEYTGQLNVSKEEFYNLLLEQLCADISNNVGKVLAVKDIKNGYRYRVKKKQGKRTIEAFSEIKKPVEYQKLVSTYEVAGRKFVMTYDIKEIDADNIEVTYTQDEGLKKENAFNKFTVIQTTKKRLKQFEKYIKANRK